MTNANHTENRKAFWKGVWSFAEIYSAILVGVVVMVVATIPLKYLTTAPLWVQALVIFEGVIMCMVGFWACCLAYQIHQEVKKFEKRAHPDNYRPEGLEAFLNADEANDDLK